MRSTFSSPSVYGNLHDSVTLLLTMSNISGSVKRFSIYVGDVIFYFFNPFTSLSVGEIDQNVSLFAILTVLSICAFSPISPERNTPSFITQSMRPPSNMHIVSSDHSVASQLASLHPESLLSNILELYMCPESIVVSTMSQL